jgi:hypothetical protein
MQVISVEQDTLDIALRVTFGSGDGAGFTAQGLLDGWFRGIRRHAHDGRDRRAAAGWISQWLIGARCAAGQELQSNGNDCAGREDAQMSREPDEALEVLRGIWSAQGQTSADLGEMGTGKSCKRMADVGFGDFDDAESDRRASWRDRLEREGKLSKDGGTVADLVLRPAQHG